MAAMPSPRVILPIDITPRAVSKLHSICRRFGCTQLSAISRLVEWYDSQPQHIRTAIVGWMNDSGKIPDLILQQMLKGAKARSKD